jgi:hypothetical protein
VIEAIAALSDSAGRMSVEPVAARRGLEEMAARLIAAHGLIAQLSAARLAAKTGTAEPDQAIRQWVLSRLACEPDDDDLDAPRVARRRRAWAHRGRPQLPARGEGRALKLNRIERRIHSWRRQG